MEVKTVRDFDAVGTVGELQDVLSRLPPDTRIITVGHFGEEDVQLYGVSIAKKGDETVLVLGGMPRSYPEPE